MQLPLGVILKNENSSGEMIEIMEEIQKLVPSTGARSGQDSTTCGEEFIVPCLFGGDQLTCEHARNSQRHRKDSATASERLEGFVSTTEDWHAKMNFYEASHRAF